MGSCVVRARAREEVAEAAVAGGGPTTEAGATVDEGGAVVLRERVMLEVGE